MPKRSLEEVDGGTDERRIDEDLVRRVVENMLELQATKRVKKEAAPTPYIGVVPGLKDGFVEECIDVILGGDILNGEIERKTFKAAPEVQEYTFQVLYPHLISLAKLCELQKLPQNAITEVDKSPVVHGALKVRMVQTQRPSIQLQAKQESLDVVASTAGNIPLLHGRHSVLMNDIENNISLLTMREPGKPQKEGDWWVQTIIWDVVGPVRVNKLVTIASNPVVKDIYVIGNEKTGEMSVRIDFFTSPDQAKQ